MALTGGKTTNFRHRLHLTIPPGPATLCLGQIASTIRLPRLLCALSGLRMHAEAIEFEDAETEQGSELNALSSPLPQSANAPRECEDGRVVASSRWCESAAKRIFDVIASALILLPLAPVLLLITLIVRWNSSGPAIFRQQRVGRHGLPFTIFKFRTMYSAIGGSTRSSHGDRRLTAPGRFLRRYKLDELPQLFNVCRGDMSLVGPRPKLHDHHVLDVCFRPGITGAATLAFASEEHLLRDIPHEHLEACHKELICPRKVELDLQYMAKATFCSDLRLLCRTLMRKDRYTSLEQLGVWQPQPSVPTVQTATRISPAAKHSFPLNPTTLCRRDTSTTLSL